MRSFRVFFDTSVLIAGLISSKGAARELLRLSEAQVIRMVVSDQVIREMDAVISRKFPSLVQESRLFWKNLEPEMAPNPSASPLAPFLSKLHKTDAEILCAAHLAKVSAFVTWNTRDFLISEVRTLASFPIVIPADCLILFKKWTEEHS